MDYIVENSICLLFWGFKMQMKIGFMVLKLWLFGFGKILENFLEEFVQTLYIEKANLSIKNICFVCPTLATLSFLFKRALLFFLERAFTLFSIQYKKLHDNLLIEEDSTTHFTMKDMMPFDQSTLLKNPLV